jgi:hypothetical protein
MLNLFLCQNLCALFLTVILIQNVLFTKTRLLIKKYSGENKLVATTTTIIFHETLVSVANLYTSTVIEDDLITRLLYMTKVSKKKVHNMQQQMNAVYPQITENKSHMKIKL